MKRDPGALAAREHDLLVVGGGIYGAACAWDAAQRGLRVALVEAADFGSGVSWNSLKTVHGGLRYLQTLDLARMRESIRERSTLLRIAPELVRPLGFLVPTYGHGPKGREALGLGLWLNELVSRDRNRGLPAERQLPAAQLLSRGQLLERLPEAPLPGLNGGALFWDAQVQSSERLLLGFLHAAADAGALCANYAELVGFLRRDGRIVGARVRDHAGGAELEVRARMTLVAAGPALAHLLELAGLRPPAVPLLRAHNLVLGRAITGAEAVGMRASGRFLFAVPWAGRSVVGTSYEPAAGGGPGWRGFLEDARRAFPWAGLEERDVAVVHSGLVPGLDAGRLASRPILIDHERRDGLPGLVSLLGEKYTTARAPAERAVDLACARLGQSHACRTAETALPRARGLDGPLAERARQAVRDEQALRLTDVVLRRLDLGSAGPPAEVDLDVVVAALSSELRWTADQAAAERRALQAACALPDA